MAYMGDDIFDIPLLKKVGFAATVPEAVDEVLECVDFVSKRGGGQGAIRELADLVPGAEFRLIRGAGHLPPIDRPEAFAAVLTEFLAALGHG